MTITFEESGAESGVSALRTCTRTAGKWMAGGSLRANGTSRTGCKLVKGGFEKVLDKHEIIIHISEIILQFGSDSGC